MPVELRCAHKLHGVLRDGVLEVKCGSKLCGHREGVVVLHEYDALTGEAIRTRTFKDPVRRSEK